MALPLHVSSNHVPHLLCAMTWCAKMARTNTIKAGSLPLETFIKSINDAKEKRKEMYGPTEAEMQSKSKVSPAQSWKEPLPP